MRLPKRDLIATGLVGVTSIVYLLWVFDATLPGLSSTRATGVVVLILGFAASASAVVPGFAGLLDGNRLYLATTSLIGLAALVAGVQMLLAASELALAIVMAAMVVLWLISTIHHTVLAEKITPRTAAVARDQTRPPVTV